MKDQELSKIKTFQTKIFDWWNTNKREFPWRETTDPYFVLLSEVMLQQTQATRSIEKFKQFVESFPTIDSLAEAQKSEVLKQWSGLGYNRRALWLQEAAKQIIELGDFPKFPEALQALKGIGPYTGRAILIFAFNYDLSTVDTNIRRILIAEGFASETNTEKELYDIAFKIQPKGRSRDWYSALMDYGATVLTAAKTGIKPVTSQSKYKNSKRFFRGKIVKLLTIREKATKNRISKECKIPIVEIDTILEKLVSDGLIKKERKSYSLP